jgi:hypothetical protein
LQKTQVLLLACQPVKNKLPLKDSPWGWEFLVSNLGESKIATETKKTRSKSLESPLHKINPIFQKQRPLNLDFSPQGRLSDCVHYPSLQHPIYHLICEDQVLHQVGCTSSHETRAGGRSWTPTRMLNVGQPPPQVALSSGSTTHLRCWNTLSKWGVYTGHRPDTKVKVAKLRVAFLEVAGAGYVLGHPGTLNVTGS